MLRCSDAFTRPLTHTSVFSSWLINKLWNEVVCLNCIWDWSGRLGTALIGGFFACFANKIPSQNFFFANFLFWHYGGVMMMIMMIYRFRQGIVQKDKEGVCLDHSLFFSFADIDP